MTHDRNIRATADACRPRWPHPWVWRYRAGEWEGRWIQGGDDEWGRITVVFRLPGRRALVVPYRWCWEPWCESCADRCPVTGRLHVGQVDGQPICEDGCGGI